MEGKQWLVGLVIAVIGGGFCVQVFLYILRGLLKLGEKPKQNSKRVPPWLTGVVERLVFGILVGLGLPGAATAMMGWLAIKLAANWNRKDLDEIDDTRAFAFAALLAGLISMLFAVLGGMVVSGKLWNGFVSRIFGGT